MNLHPTAPQKNRLASLKWEKAGSGVSDSEVAASISSVTHCYNDLGQLERKSLGGTLQTLDYAYNIRGWLTKTNTSTLPSVSNLFSFGLEYFLIGTINQYNSSMKCKVCETFISRWSYFSL